VKALIRRAWQSRAPRERLFVVLLIAVSTVGLGTWLMQSASGARRQLGASVLQLRTQAERLDKNADEIDRLRALPGRQASTSGQDLRTLMQAKVASAGLTRFMASIDGLDPTHVKVTFGAVPFADWLAWVEALESQQIRLDTTRIEALSTPGLASVTAVFARSGP
jgi:general secretion pathway protein M